MPTPQISTNFADLLDPRFQRIFHDQYRKLPDMVPELYMMDSDNGRNEVKYSGVGAYGDWSEFNGTVAYDSAVQGYDTTLTHKEFCSGTQVERKLFDDDQYQIINKRPAGLADSAQRTRQKHAAAIFGNAFSVDSSFYSNSEGVALCSTAHLTNATGVSTATGFSNKVTTALSATSLASARIQMINYRDDRGNKIGIMPDEIWIPEDLYATAFEIIESEGKPDTANNNKNVHKSAFTVKRWLYMTDANDWFLCDSEKRKQWLPWVDRVGIEFAMAEDIDTMIAKWRGYMRYSMGWLDWRWVLGASVS